MKSELPIFAAPGTVALAFQGCKVNQYETQALREELLRLGWTELPFGEAADLVIVNSCTVTAGSDRDLRKLLSRARRGAPEARILVTGCRAEVAPGETLALEGVTAVAGNPSKPFLAAALTGVDVELPGSHPERVSGGLIRGMGGRGRALLKVQDGCDLRCAYCIVPSARGASRSRGARETLEAVRILAEEGFAELVLSGIQLGLYKDPDGEAPDLAALLALLLRETEGVRFRLGSLLPRHLGEDLIRLFAENPRRLCPHLHLSLQSGDDGVLRRMRRPYDSALYREALRRLDAALDDPCLGTDLIVGHPGEDEAAFEASFRLVRESPLSQGHVFPFSPRPGTRAAEWGDPVPHEVKAERGRRLRELFAEKAAAYRRRQEGRVLEVVAERSEDGFWRGTSGNYQQVRFEASGLRRGELAAVEIRGAENEILEGNILKTGSPGA